MDPPVTESNFTVTAPNHFKALAHPLRHRLMFALGEPATISQLAKRMTTGKGNIAHHLKVLAEVGMVRVVSTRKVRGGTEQYYQRSTATLTIAPKAPELTAASMAAIAEEITNAADEPLLSLRHIRLTPEQAQRLRTLLSETVDALEPASDEDHRYGVVVSMYQQRDAVDG